MAALWRRCMKVIGIVFAVFTVLLVLLFFSLPKLHENKLKRDLNNEIVNQNYLNWEQIDLDANISMKLPEVWTLRSTDDGMMIVDDSDTIIAVGTIIAAGTKEDGFALFSEHYGSAVVSYQSEVLGTGNYGSLASAHIIRSQHEDGSEREQIILYLPFYNKYKYRFCFFPTEYSKEVEAIAWSMEYNEK